MLHSLWCRGRRVSDVPTSHRASNTEKDVEGPHPGMVVSIWGSDLSECFL